MWSKAYPVWGCRCCAGDPAGGRTHKLWNVYHNGFSRVKRAPLMIPRHECRVQGKNWGNMGTPEMCIAKSGCSSVMFSAAYKSWGCRCCTVAAGGRPHKLWNVYRNNRRYWGLTEEEEANLSEEDEEVVEEEENKDIFIDAQEDDIEEEDADDVIELAAVHQDGPNDENLTNMGEGEKVVVPKVVVPAKSNNGLVIGIVVGLIALAAGVAVACYCKSKNTGDAEGGDRDAFSLSKTEGKKSATHKQSLVDANES